MTIARQLACHMAAATYDLLPTIAVRAAKASLLDTLAVAVAARAAPGVSEVLDLAITDGGRPASSLWSRAERVPPRSAAFANSYLASALDFDSLHQEGVAHADIVIVPSAVAVGEDVGASGRALVTAIAVGDDILCRLCRSTRGNTGWFYTSLYGPLASAAVAAGLLGGGESVIESAMGIGSMSASGTQQPAVERSMGKRMQGALAAGAGVSAGYLAARKLDGPHEFVEGRFGLYAMCEKGDAGAITQDLGSSFENSRISYKLYPSCQCNHAAIEGLLWLQSRHDLTHQTVKAVEVTVSPYMHRLVGAPFSPGRNPQVAAQFSVQYSIASVLLHGRLGVREISDATVVDPVILNITRRVSVVIDPENRNNYAPARLKVTAANGDVFEHDVTSFRGSDENPFTEADFKEKLAMCVESAGGSVKGSKIDNLFDDVMNIEDIRNVAAFTSNFISRCLA